MLVPLGHYDARELEGLPAPVQRSFREVLKDGQPLIAASTFELAGTINMLGTGGEEWQPFTSAQTALTHPPCFLWNGRVAMPAGLVAHVHDSYIAGAKPCDWLTLRASGSVEYVEVSRERRRHPSET